MIIELSIELSYIYKSQNNINVAVQENEGENYFQIIWSENLLHSRGNTLIVLRLKYVINLEGD